MNFSAFSARPEGPLLALGELLVDLIPAEEGMRIRDPGPVLKTASGSAGIFACAASRLGAPVRFIGKVGQDSLSCLVTEAIRREGVDTSCLSVSPEGQIGLAFLEYTDSGRNYQYYRSSSVGSRLSPEDIPETAFSDASLLHFPGMLLDLNDTMREACLHAVSLAKQAGAALSFDPNIRREVMSDPDARRRMLSVLSQADLITPTLDEGRQLTGRQDPGEVLRALRDLGPQLVVLTMDSRGALFCTGDRVIQADPFPVQEVDPTGAGDTFAAALCAGLRENMPLDRLAAFCNAAGALAVTQRGAVGLALPSRADVDALISSVPIHLREKPLSGL